MRRVFDNAMVAHVWAQQEQPEGRSHNGNFYFEGPTLYSYGAHYVVGRFVQNDRGQRAVLLNTRSYFPTTTSHKGLAEEAVHGLGLPIFHVPGATVGHADNLRYYAEAAGRAAATARRAHMEWSRAANNERAMALLSEARHYARFFALDWNEPGLDGLAEAAEAEAARAVAVARRRLAEKRESDRRAFEEWLAGVRDHCPPAYAIDKRGSVYMRARGDVLETSRGASVPLGHALKVFRFVKRCREAGEEFRANGRTIRVGHFQVSKITAQGDMVAGCHYLSWERIAEVAAAIGVLDLEPSSEAVEVRPGAA